MRARAACLFAVLICGCATVDRLGGELCAPAPVGRRVNEVVHVMNTNWLLFSFLPIASGDPRRPNEDCCAWFRNTVTLQNQIDMLEAEARRAGASKAVNVFTERSGESVLVFFLQREKLHTSAVLVNEEGTDMEDVGP